MPELPEVETVRAGLAGAVVGARITAARIDDERSLRRHDAGSGPFVDRVAGRRVSAAVRRGKFLWLPLSGAAGDEPGEALVAHLGMSGQLVLKDAGTPAAPLTRVRLVLDHGAGEPREVHFVDQRVFGSLAVEPLVPTGDARPGGAGWDAPVLPVRVAHIARDPLDPDLDERALLARLAARRTSVKAALLDQTLVSGVGNIYADESLWAARIHPEQPIASLSAARARLLLDEVRVVLARAVEAGGTSFDALYVNVNGASGRYSDSLAVYGREGRPCPRCGTPIVRIPFANRSSRFCPRCQRVRAARGRG